MDNMRLARLLADIDNVNDGDPVKDAGHGSMARARLYGLRMSERLGKFAPQASEALQIAARAQHIERWTSRREDYEEGRIGYLKWRKDLQAHHARRTGELMARQGYAQADIDRVGSLLRKERLKMDAEAQALEDVVCLVFLEFEAPAFIAKHDDAKVSDILAKTAKKMSAQGLAEIASLPLDARLKRLIAAL